MKKSFKDHLALDGPRIRTRELIRREEPIFITLERFVQIASKLRFAILVPQNSIRNKGFGSGSPLTWFVRIACANRFARIEPSISTLRALVALFHEKQLPGSILKNLLRKYPPEACCRMSPLGVQPIEEDHSFVKPLILEDTWLDGCTTVRDFRDNFSRVRASNKKLTPTCPTIELGAR